MRLALVLTGRHSRSGSTASTGTTTPAPATTPAGHITDFAENSEKENNVEIPTNENFLNENVEPQTQTAETVFDLTGHAAERNADTRPEQSAFTQFDSPEFGQIRVRLNENGDLWFVAKDVCRVLDIQNVSDTLRKALDEDERGVDSIYTLGGMQQMSTVSESGMYSLIFRSRKPEARRFRKWVTTEIIPAIRNRADNAAGTPPSAKISFQSEAVEVETQTLSNGAVFDVAGNDGTPSVDTSAGTGVLTQFVSPEFGRVRTIKDDDGNFLFVAKDVAIALGYEWNGVARIAHVPEEWRGVTSVVTHSRGVQNTHFLTEQGLYFFLGRSDKPAALPFQKWVAGEVIPAIRKRGAYVAPTNSEELSFGPSILRRLAAEWEKDRQALIAAEDLTWKQCMARIDATERAEAENVARRASDQRANAAIHRAAQLEARIQLLQEGNDGRFSLSDPAEVRPAKPRKFRVWKNEDITIRELAKHIRADTNCRVGINQFYQFLRANGYLNNTKRGWNMPTAHSLKTGLFKIGRYARAKFIVTQKGQSYFVELFHERNNSKNGEQNS
jgi:prophage antirepressor-like protein